MHVQSKPLMCCARAAGLLVKLIPSPLFVLPSLLYRLQHHAATQQLCLAPQQQQAIADSLSLAKRLVSPLLIQLQLLHADVAAADEQSTNWHGPWLGERPGTDVSNSKRNAAVRTSTTLNSQVAAAPPQSACAVRRLGQLAIKQELADKLLRVLRKDWLLSCAFQCHVLGCLSWQQLGLLMVCR
jgi:hypothetical protein